MNARADVKTAEPAGASAAQRHRISIVMNGKGGVGKTTFALFVRDAYKLAGVPLRAIEIDTKKRLSAFLGNQVQSLEIPSYQEARRNLDALASLFDPIWSAAEDGYVLVDVGANMDGQLLEWAEYAQVDRDFVELGVGVDIYVPTLDEAESVKGAEEVLDRAGRVLPSARRVLVLNERDGDAFRTIDRADLDRRGIIVKSMPRVTSELWSDAQWDRAGYLQIMAMNPAQIAERWKYPRPKANRAKVEFAQWFGTLQERFGDILPRRATSA